ncbi:uncharacterized protein LOC131151506 [Malania oleifera]|uniref:uncharacterized protein LOC131151506 n=1 Tax=Malania oleifera TaxID=397392 RepID=UPI0025AE6082|nr:uncharacterized protein LOC131151506 [Malania oleifera]
MYRLVKKLQIMRKPLRDLNTLHFSHISCKAKKANEELIELQQNLHNSPEDMELQIQVASKKNMAIKLAEANRSFLTQQAKTKYQMNSDRNTAFFHSLMKRHTRGNHIVSVIKSNGESTTSQVQVAEEFLSFYKSLPGSDVERSSIDPQIIAEGLVLNDEQAQQMIAPIADEEIKQAMFSIGDEKSSGHVGYTSCFFKKSWGIVGDEVILAVKEFFGHGKLLKQLNHTTIALIPKSTHASLVQNYRPISWYNVFKVISKILAGMINPCLDQIVNLTQSAFVKQGCMVDNIYLVQELVKKYAIKRISC